MVRTGLMTLAAALLLAACGSKPAAIEAPAISQEQDLAAVRAFLAQVETSFNEGRFDTFMDVFTDDAVQLNAGMPDVVGKAAIRSLYEGALATTDIKVQFHTAEVVIDGDLAYESGTYTLHLANKADGKPLADVTNRHVHILRRQADGSWKTWRMMTNNAEAGGPPP